MARRPYTKTEQVQTTITRPQREQLDGIAAAVPCSRAKLIERYVLEGMERDGKIGAGLRAPLYAGTVPRD